MKGRITTLEELRLLPDASEHKFGRKFRCDRKKRRAQWSGFPRGKGVCFTCCGGRLAIDEATRQ